MILCLMKKQYRRPCRFPALTNTNGKNFCVEPRPTAAYDDSDDDDDDVFDHCERYSVGLSHSLLVIIILLLCYYIHLYC